MGPITCNCSQLIKEHDFSASSPLLTTKPRYSTAFATCITQLLTNRTVLTKLFGHLFEKKWQSTGLSDWIFVIQISKNLKLRRKCRVTHLDTDFVYLFCVRRRRVQYSAVIYSCDIRLCFYNCGLRTLSYCIKSRRIIQKQLQPLTQGLILWGSRLAVGKRFWDNLPALFTFSVFETEQHGIGLVRSADSYIILHIRYSSWHLPLLLLL